jgi:glucose-1-phosphate thymidylyltransferase
MSTTRAIVLARGLGTRMRVDDPDVAMTIEQRRAAGAGLKAMIPLNGRPFLDYLLSALADAGIRDVALIIAPEHEEVRRYYTAIAPPSRVSLSYLHQHEPLGTAHAVLTAERWTGGAPFLAMNGDNLYPVDVLRTLASLDEPGLPAFDRDDLVRTSNIPKERILAFALIDVDAEGYLRAIVEKPDSDLPQESHPWVSMNCWHFDARIFDACRDVPRSARGEFEIPEAVALAIGRGLRFKTFPASGPVLDLSRRADAVAVANRLAGVTPRP